MGKIFGAVDLRNSTCGSAAWGVFRIWDWVFRVLTALLTATCLSASSQTLPSDALTNPPPSLWQAAPGEGFRKGAHELDVSGGVGIGLKVLTSVGQHDWGIAVVDYGWVFTDVLGDSHWYRGNWELLADLFGGYQYRAEGAYFVGVGPHLRYNFAAGHRWTPFIDFGAGVSATDIREPDLSTTFEFNLQGGIGTHYYICEDLALTAQWRFIHLSNAGIKYTNLGVNSSTFLLGVSWFF